MNDRLLVVLLMAMLPCTSFGQDLPNYLCTHGNLQRRVEILSEPGLTVPCEVHYYKDTETGDERQVLWRAMNEEGYCERKTREFVAKLHDLGWTCGQDTGAGQKAELQQADDTGQDAMQGLEDDTASLLPGEEVESPEEL